MQRYINIYDAYNTWQPRNHLSSRRPHESFTQIHVFPTHDLLILFNQQQGSGRCQTQILRVNFHQQWPLKGETSMSRSYPSTSSCGSLLKAINGPISWDPSTAGCVYNNKPFRRARIYKNTQTCTSITHSSKKWVVCSWFQKFTSLVGQFRSGLNK